MSSQKAVIAEGDALVIPARVRRELGLEVGDTVMLEIAAGELRLRSRDASILRAQKLMRQLVPDGVSLADELIKERQADATHE